MIFAKLYRKDLITGEFVHVIGSPMITRGDVRHLHLMATLAVKRTPEAGAYQIWQGDTFANAKPISLMHDVEGF